MKIGNLNIDKTGLHLIKGHYHIDKDHQRYKATPYPTMQVTEIHDTLYKADKSISASVKIQFENLDVLQDLRYILIFYEVTKYQVNLPSVVTVIYLQSKDILCELPIFVNTNDLYTIKQVPLYLDKSIRYSFYALYLDSSHNPIMNGDVPYFSADINKIITGLAYNETLFGVKDLVIISPKIDALDLNDIGFSNPVEIDTTTIELSWLNMERLSDSDFLKEYDSSDVFRFTDTFNQMWELKPVNFQHVDYYAIYVFENNTGFRPTYQYPFGIIPKQSLHPQPNEANGRWILYGTTKENSATIELNPGVFAGIFVGVKLL